MDRYAAQTFVLGHGALERLDALAADLTGALDVELLVRVANGKVAADQAAVAIVDAERAAENLTRHLRAAAGLRAVRWFRPTDKIVAQDIRDLVVAVAVGAAERQVRERWGERWWPKGFGMVGWWWSMIRQQTRG